MPNSFTFDDQAFLSTSRDNNLIFLETFEGIQVDNRGSGGYDLPGWEVISSGGNPVVNPNYTTFVAEGNYSCQIVSSNVNGCFISRDLPENNNIWGKFRLRAGGSPGSSRALIQGFSPTGGANNPVFTLQWGSSSTGPLRIVAGSASTTVNTMAIGTWYYIWFSYQKGTGNNGVIEACFSETESKPTVGDNRYTISTNQNKNQSISYITIGVSSNALNPVYDQIEFRNKYFE